MYLSDLFPKGADFIEGRKGTLSGRLIVQRNVVFSTGNDWKLQRMVANPAFHRSLPINLFGLLSQKVFMQMDQILEQPIEFRGMMERLTLDSIGLVSFGFNFHAIENPESEWKVRYETIFKAAIDPRYLLFPFVDRHLLFLFPERRKMHQELTKFHGMMQKVIDEKRNQLRTTGSSLNNDWTQDAEMDLLTLMLAAGEEGKGTLSDELLKNNLCIFFIAGHESSANALSSAVYYLAVNQDIQQKARKEAINVLGDQQKDVMPTAEQAREFKYIDMIAREALRMNPPISMAVPRTASEDTELDGVFIPKGTKVIVDANLHHSTSVWKDPHIFKPERFAPNGEAEKVMKETNGTPWLAFGYGSRQCIGMNFSVFQERVFLSMLCKYNSCGLLSLLRYFGIHCMISAKV
ncbi:cytochrome P450 [Fennellomyces sp. T-0311]|nr:cytochrome P450 [Fennellomyces sp. T-0311]